MKNPACKFDFFGRLPFVNKNIRSFLRFGAFLLILVLVVLLANAVLIQTDTYSSLPLAELKSRDDIDLAVVGSSIVGEHLNANLVSEQTGLTAFSASVPSLSLQGEIALTREIYRKNSPAYTVLSLEPYNLNSAKEYTSAYYRLTPYLSSWRDKITYYLDACREDGLYLDRLFMFREFGVESLSDILKTVGLRLNPLKTYEKLKPTLDDTVTYEGSGFLRYDREPDVADLVREKLQREEMPDGYVYELLEPTKALLLRYKALCEEKGSQLMILLFPNLTAHALAEPEYLPYCESLMAFCRENGIPRYNFQYVKADYMENLDAYYYDLYHLNGEGADKFSAFFARFFNAYVGGEDVDGWFYADSAEYLASVDRVTNAWLMRHGDQFVADCNRGTQVTPLYRFCLSTDGVQTLLRDYSEDNTLPVSAVPAGSSVFVYAVPAGQPDAEPVFDMIWSSELGAYGT